MPYFIAYLIAGLLITFAHPQLRKILVDSTGNKEQGILARGVLFVALVFFMMLLWPVVLVFRGRNSAGEDRRLTEMKEHVVARGRKITESDGVLMTYRRVIEKQFREAAKERGERLPEPAMREIVLHYIDHWVSANGHRLGMAMPFLINGGVATYKERGLQALLEEIRKDELTEG